MSSGTRGPVPLPGRLNLAPPAPMLERTGGRLVTIVQGEYHVSGEPELRVSTVLGSCVAVTLHDRSVALSGINHFMLPQECGPGDGPAGNRLRYGTHAMEQLINAMMAAGARRGQLRAKVFGGAAVMPRLSDIGAQNIAFIRRFLRDEGFVIDGEDVGGTAARRVILAPSTGQAWVKRVDAATTRGLGEAELAVSRSSLTPRNDADAVQLF